jgi:superfamily II RNA helicase
LAEKLNEAARQAEIERLERLAAEERRRQEEDRRRVQQSVKDSQAQLVQIIQAWADVMNVERFLQGVQDRAAALPADERDRR